MLTFYYRFQWAVKGHSEFNGFDTNQLRLVNVLQHNALSSFTDQSLLCQNQC